MIITFESKIILEKNKYYFSIPMNIWEEFGLKGNIPVKVSIKQFEYECKLTPKGKGYYYLPIAKKYQENLLDECFEINMEFINNLSRITKDSPYNTKHPIRKINNIKAIPLEYGLCGHCCIAMLAEVSKEEVISLIGKQISWSKIIEALDYYGINHKEMNYQNKDLENLSCAIVYKNNGFNLWYKNQFIDESKLENVIGYLEIVLD